MFEKIKYGELRKLPHDKSLYKEFTDKKEIEEWGEKYYGEWAKQYTSTIQLANKVMTGGIAGALEVYCGYEYRNINSYLRTREDNEYNRSREQALILALSICSAPTIPQKLILYRLVSDEFIEMMIKKNKYEGCPMIEKGFMSTSLIKDIANQDGEYTNHKNLLKIFVDENTSGVYVNVVEKRQEYEMLLLPNNYLGLVNYPYKDKSSGKIIYECILI